MDVILKKCSVDFNIEASECYQRAAEYSRLIKSSLSASTLNKFKLNSYNLALISFNLACDMLLYPFDQVNVFQVSFTSKNRKKQLNFMVLLQNFIKTVTLI